MRNDQVSLQVRTNLGNRIRELRVAQGLSQYTFSDMVGLDRSYLIAVEKGRRNVSVDNLFKVANGLGVTMSDLFQGVDEFVYAYVSLKD